GDGETGPRSMPFDAVANLRMLGDVQRRGLEAAEAVIARLTERTNPAGSATPSAPGNPMSDVSSAFVDSVAALAAAMGSAVGVPTGASAQPAGGSGPVEVVATRTRPGVAAEVELWLHNYTDDPASGVEVHVTDLVAADGSLLSASNVQRRPDGPLELTPESSRRVRLVVDVGSDVPGGRYRGIATAANLADQWLVLEVEVSVVEADQAQAESTG